LEFWKSQNSHFKVAEDPIKQKHIEEFMNSILSIAAHEMRTPINIIKGDAELLIKAPSQALSDPEVVKLLESIEKNSDRLLKLVDNFLSLNVLKEKKIFFSKVQFDIMKLVGEVSTDLTSQAEEEGLYIKIENPSEPLPDVVADPDKTREVIMNIIRNSLENTDKGGVTVSFEKDSGSVKMLVRDTGRGIDPEHQKTLFQKKSQNSKGEKHDHDIHDKKFSSGLGLYISKFFMESMGGAIWLEKSDADTGTVFVITLPAKNKNNNMDQKQLILIVDDEKEILDIYGTALGQAGFEVITSSNGVEAIEIAKQKHPALILMDVKMPLMNGIESVLKLRADSDMNNTKIVFITAFDDPRVGMDVKVAETIGTIDVIKKGLSLDELVTKIRTYLS
jgi:CheY-like chemotaxis protein